MEEQGGKHKLKEIEYASTYEDLGSIPINMVNYKSMDKHIRKRAILQLNLGCKVSLAEIDIHPSIKSL